jgi:hypothetical protein
MLLSRIKSLLFLFIAEANHPAEHSYRTPASASIIGFVAVLIIDSL